MSEALNQESSRFFVGRVERLACEVSFLFFWCFGFCFLFCWFSVGFLVGVLFCLALLVFCFVVFPGNLFSFASEVVKTAVVVLLRKKLCENIVSFL